MTQSPLSIPPALVQRCFAHGASTYPEEGCGALSGPANGDAVDGYHPIANILNQMHAEDPERYPRTGANGYFMDPAEMMRLEKALAAEGRAVKVIFHSHVDVGAYFSAEDKTRALWAGQPLLPGIAYLVCGVKARQPDGAILAWFDDDAGDFLTAPVEG
ncbi:MAG TPA: M67 family metallopeptidase [bacterium]|nr:M67 family metallopeptidase [bacterium]